MATKQYLHECAAAVLQATLSDKILFLLALLGFRFTSSVHVRLRSAGLQEGITQKKMK